MYNFGMPFPSISNGMLSVLIRMASMVILMNSQFHDKINMFS